MMRRDQIEAETSVLVARLIAGERIVEASDASLVPDILRAAADRYESFLRTGLTQP